MSAFVFARSAYVYLVSAVAVGLFVVDGAAEVVRARTPSGSRL